MNHLSSDIPETVWWKQQALMEPIPKNPSPNSHQIYNHSYHHQRPAATARMFCGQNTAFAFNLNQEDDEEELRADGDGDQFQVVVDMKEPMFEKPLTPSDVGKLNRLVIPKQHAEKYFPLGGGGDSGGGEKGLLLSFEDESGKSWRFRYSYWNSSQSYVLTKGWSRYVKEKRLDAGDVVLFERHRVDGDRLFIGWRRRSAAAENGVAQPVSAAAAVANTGGGGWTQVLYSAHSYPVGPPIPYQPHCPHAGAVVQSQTTTTPKRLRLFGVNLECQPDHESEPSTPDGSPMSTSQGEQAHYNHQYSSSSSSSTNPHGSNQGREAHMDINFSRDVNQMRYHRG